MKLPMTHSVKSNIKDMEIFHTSYIAIALCEAIVTYATEHIVHVLSYEPIVWSKFCFGQMVPAFLIFTFFFISQFPLHRDVIVGCAKGHYSLSKDN